VGYVHACSYLENWLRMSDPSPLGKSGWLAANRVGGVGENLEATSSD
jgi:hypothetical protein